MLPIEIEVNRSKIEPMRCKSENTFHLNALEQKVHVKVLGWDYHKVNMLSLR
jgi:hypothetical protein